MVIVVVFEEGFEGSMVYDVVLEFVDYYVGLECIYIIGVLVLVEDVQCGISGDFCCFIFIVIVLIFIGFYIFF